MFVSSDEHSKHIKELQKQDHDRNRHELIVSINGLPINVNETELNNKLSSFKVSAQACLGKPLQSFSKTKTFVSSTLCFRLPVFPVFFPSSPIQYVLSSQQVSNELYLLKSFHLMIFENCL